MTFQSPPVISDVGAAVEQTSQGKRLSATLAEDFEGLGATFESPKGGAIFPKSIRQ